MRFDASARALPQPGRPRRKRPMALPETASAAAPALDLAGVHKQFGATAIIRGVTLAIPRGERHAIIGPNGAGKSTLFNLMSGRLRATRGTIRLFGEDI